MVAFLTLDDVDVRGKTVGVRIDINSAIVNGKIEKSERLVAHAKTVKELAQKKAKVVVLAHQGRRGGKDYRELDEHVALLRKAVRMKVQYVRDVCGTKAVAAIQKLNPGGILMLRNVRSLSEEAQEKTPEQHAQSRLVRVLQSVFEVYVQDAFSNAHRSHASMVGFFKIPNVAGRVMQGELEALAHVEKPKHPFVFLLGGIKTAEVIELIEKMQGVDTFLVAGTVGELCCLAKGYRLGKKEELLKAQGDIKFLNKVKVLLKKKKIIFPHDFAVKKNRKRTQVGIGEQELQEFPVRDIGARTIGEFSEVLKRAKTIYMKGPVGAYEDTEFQRGTRAVLYAILHSKAFSLAGGGNTLSATKLLSRDAERNFSHMSLGGGALLAFLLKKKLPCLEVMAQWKRR